MNLRLSITAICLAGLQNRTLAASLALSLAENAPS